MSQEAARFGLLAIALLAPACDGHEGDIAAGKADANLLGGLQAVHHRHAQVEQDDAWAEAIDFGQGGGAAMHNLNLVALEAQETAQAIRGIDVVIDDENSK